MARDESINGYFENIGRCHPGHGRKKHEHEREQRDFLVLGDIGEKKLAYDTFIHGLP